MLVFSSILLIISAIISSAVSIYYFQIFEPLIAGTPSIGDMLGSALVFPHIFLVWLATLFNWLGLFTRKKPLTLTAGILYAVSMLLMAAAFKNVILQTMLTFIAYAFQRPRGKDID